MKKMHLKIATRKSPMAIWQANYVKSKLLAAHPHLTIELIGLITQGDKQLQTPLVEVGGKSLFVKELQNALIQGDADIAVHCIKDMSVHDHPELSLTAICEREDPRDAFISNQHETISDLPPSAIVGTSSPRRESLLKSMAPSVITKSLRGNVNTRLQKLDNKEYEGMILAVAGLKRLDLTHRIKQYLDPTIFIPAIGQGALGIECRAEDDKIQSLVRILHHVNTALCIEAERAVNRVLGGNCYTPIGAHASLHHETLVLRAMVGSIDGKKIIRAEEKGPVDKPETLGMQIAQCLLKKGAKSFIDAI